MLVSAPFWLFKSFRGSTRWGQGGGLAIENHQSRVSVLHRLNRVLQTHTCVSVYVFECMCGVSVVCHMPELLLLLLLLLLLVVVVVVVTGGGHWWWCVCVSDRFTSNSTIRTANTFNLHYSWWVGSAGQTKRRVPAVQY